MERIELIDENGKKQVFELLDTFGMDEQDYAVLLPIEPPQEETYILRIETDADGEAYFAGIEDEEELDNVIVVYEELKKESLQ